MMVLCFGLAARPIVPREEFLMKFRPFYLVMGLAATLSSAGLVNAQCSSCGGGEVVSSGCGVPSCGPQYTEKTIMVPQYVTETKVVTVTQYQQETRQRTYKVCKQVPRTEEKTTTYTQMVQQQQTQDYTVQVPVTTMVEQSYTVRVPKMETREESYSVNVPVYTTVDVPIQ